MVVPFLRYQGIRHLDSLIVSHGDNDHIGGVKSLLAAYPAGRLLSGTPAKLPGTAVEQCHAGDRWRWDGVIFTLLHPQPGDRVSGNNASCVLRIELPAGQRVLLTGDIEARSERRLLKGGHGSLSADLLVAPHHGSLTSSSPAFVQAVNPAIVLFPAGYRNRFNFPKQDIVERYLAIGAKTYSSGDHGAITLRLGSLAGERLQISLHRGTRQHYWNP